MSSTQSAFYVTGGTLHRNAPSYVPRQADEDLYVGLNEGKFCYVLTSRQMGKSSLMVRTAVRLQNEGVAVALLDLTSIGQNVTAEQWYDGLVERLGKQLKLQAELEDFWLDHERLAPIQRWLQAIREVVLPNRKGRIVIFVDEIDSVQSLRFSTDEFFAGIRSLYNGRAEDAELNRLTFCLLGVATPSDLIRDPRTTPFNIGKRIELGDFTESEAVPLTNGLNHEKQLGTALLKRILYWTGGHPYLTQKLCLAVAEAGTVKRASGVDRICEEIFLSTRARAVDDNLLFVHDRMLQSSVDRAGLLDLYAKVRKHKSIRDDDKNRLTSVLRLSGIVRAIEGFLLVRNRIYFRVFDHQWVIANMPDAELQRQRAAYRHGLIRAAAIASIVVATVGGLGIFAFTQAVKANRAAAALENSYEELRRANERLQVALKEAEAQKQNADQQRLQADQEKQAAQKSEERAKEESLAKEVERKRAEDLASVAKTQTKRAMEAEAKSRSELYVTRMTRTQQLSERAEVDRAERLLDKIKAETNDLGFEWFYLWRLIHSERFKLPKSVADRGTSSARFTADDKRLVTVSLDGKIETWDADGGQFVGEMGRTQNDTPETPLVQESGTLGEAKISDTKKPVRPVFSVSGDKLLTVRNGKVTLWDRQGDQFSSPKEFDSGIGEISLLALSPDSRRLAAVTTAAVAYVWDSDNPSPVRQIDMAPLYERLEMKLNPGDRISALSFPSDSKTLVTGDDRGTVVKWDLNKVFQEPQSENQQSPSAQQSPQTSTTRPTATTEPAQPGLRSEDQRSRRRSTTEQSATTPSGVPMPEKLWIEFGNASVTSIDISPKDQICATASGDGSVIIREFKTGKELLTLHHIEAVQSVAFSHDGKFLATASSDRAIRIWRMQPLRQSARIQERLLPQDDNPSIFSWFQKDNTVLDSLLAWGGPLNGTFTRRSLSVMMAPTPGIIRDDFRRREIPIAVFIGHSLPITMIAFSADSKKLVSSSEDKSVKVWDINDNPQYRTVNPFAQNSDTEQSDSEDLSDSADILSVAFSPSKTKRMVAIGGSTAKRVDYNTLTETGVLDLYDVDKDVTVRLRGHESVINAVTFSADGSMLASASGDKTVKLWDVATGEELQTLRGHSRSVWCVAFSPDGSQLASASADRSVKLWDVKSGRALHVLAKHSGPVVAVAFSPNGKTLASGSWDNKVRLWDTSTGEEIFTETELSGNTGIEAIVFSPNGRLLIAGGADGKIKFWDITDLRKPASVELEILDWHATAITYITFSPDGRTFATASMDETVKLWDLKTGRELMNLSGPGVVWSLSFSPDSKTLAAAGGDGTVRLWRAATDQEIENRKILADSRKKVATSQKYEK